MKVSVLLLPYEPFFNLKVAFAGNITPQIVSILTSLSLPFYCTPIFLFPTFSSVLLSLSPFLPFPRWSSDFSVIDDHTKHIFYFLHITLLFCSRGALFGRKNQKRKNRICPMVKTSIKKLPCETKG